MTLSPFRAHVVVRRPDLPGYPLNEVCAHPHCGLPATDDHHCETRGAGWPRNKDYHWLEIDGKHLVPARVGLCRPHHEDLTGSVGGHRAQLLWVESEGYYWIDLRTREGELLEPQPLPSFNGMVDRLQADGWSAMEAEELLGRVA